MLGPGEGLPSVPPNSGAQGLLSAEAWVAGSSDGQGKPGRPPRSQTEKHLPNRWVLDSNAVQAPEAQGQGLVNCGLGHIQPVLFTCLFIYLLFRKFFLFIDF